MALPPQDYDLGELNLGMDENYNVRDWKLKSAINAKYDYTLGSDQPVEYFDLTKRYQLKPGAIMGYC